MTSKVCLRSFRENQLWSWIQLGLLIPPATWESWGRIAERITDVMGIVPIIILIAMPSWPLIVSNVFVACIAICYVIHLLFTQYLCSSFICFIYYIAKNVPEVKSAMKKIRAMNGYFESSTQAMKKLLDFQRDSNIKEYKDQVHAKKTLQDVITRWWSTYRSLRRTRWLKKAIKGLIASEQISVEDLTPDEWLVMHQIEIVLETMAYYQRILEGEKYVTGSLCVIAVYQIRKAYVDIIACEDTSESVIALTRILLKDFDERYHPSENGMVTYFREDELGKGNRYIGLHQYFFFAAFLDPRVLPILLDIITEEDAGQLEEDILDAMVARSKLMRSKKSNLSDQGTPPATQTPSKAMPTKKKSKSSQMFRGLNTKPKASVNASDRDDESLRNDCQAQLNRYMNDAEDGGCPLEDEDDLFNDPLMWWKENTVKYDLVASLARLYLAVPATSAPSERVWSRAARILSLRRASLKEGLVARMMFVRENMKFLRKHYVRLACADREDHLHEFVRFEMEYFPPLRRGEEMAEVDVGQEDHLLDF